MPRNVVKIQGRMYSDPLALQTGPSGEFAVDMYPGSVESGFYQEVSSLSGLASSKVGTASLWCYYDQNQAITQFLMSVDASNSENAVFEISITNGRISVIGRNESLGNAWIFLGDSTVLLQDDSWNHILLAWDLANSIGMCYINDTDAYSANSTNVISDTPVGYSRSNERMTIGGGEYIGSFWYECMAVVWFDTSYLDISVQANRRKFITSGGLPEVLGVDGSSPTGSSPLVYLDNPASSFATNRGTAGDFLEFGSPADCASAPNP